MISGTDLLFNPGMAFQDLGQGDTRIVTVQIQVSDGNDVSTIQDIDITVTGVNDDSVIASVSDPAAINEVTGDSSAQVIVNAMGSLNVDDDDNGDTLTGVVGTTVVAELDGVDASANASVNAFIANAALTFPSTGLSDGTTQTLNYVFNASASDLDFLTAGEVLTLEYAVQVNDGTSNSTADTVVITINGTNDVPSITAATNPTNIAEVTGDSSGQDIAPVTGTITIDDADVGDALVLSVTGNGTSFWSGDISGVAPVSVSSLVASNAISFDTLTSNGGAQTIDWTYDPAASNLDFLAVGETLTITYVAQVTDDGGSNQYGPQNLVITIEGTNDLPVLTAVTVAGMIEEDVTLSTSGSITFADVDANDAPMAMVSNVVSVTGVDANNDPISITTLDAANIDAAFNISAPGTNNNNGTVNWDYTIANPAVLDFLADGEVVTATFEIIVDDGHGVTVSENVTITINGTNDAPVIALDAAAPHTIADTAAADAPGSLDVTGTLTETDLDVNDTHTFSIGDGTTLLGAASQTSAYGTLTVNPDGTYSFDVDNAAVDALDLGDNPTVTFDVQVSDGTTTSATTLDFNITGINDNPIANNDFVAEDAGSDLDFNPVFGGVMGTVIDTDAENHSLTLIGGVDPVSYTHLTLPTKA